MSCSTKGGPAAVCEYITKTTGYDVTSSDWHSLTRYAQEAGYLVSRERADKNTLDYVAEKFRRGTFGDHSDYEKMLAGLQESNTTTTTVAIMRYLTTPDVSLGRTMSQLFAERNPLAAAKSPKELDRVEAAKTDLNRKSITAELLKRKTPAVVLALASNPTTTTSTLRELVSGADVNTTQRLLWNPNSDDTVFRAIGKASGSHPSGRISAARHPRTSAELLTEYSTDAESVVRGIVGAHANTPHEIRVKLIGDNERVRSVMATGNIEDDILDALSKDPEYEVRLNVAKNRATGTATLEFLSGDMSAIGYNARVQLGIREERKAANLN